MTQVVESKMSWDGRLLSVYPAGIPRVTIMRMTIPSHAKSETHLHPMINAGTVLRREFTVVAEDCCEKTFRTGERIVELIGRRHYGETGATNRSSGLMFYAGVEGMPLSGK